jgi:NADPH-ferrihemoprotein reductase
MDEYLVPLVGAIIIVGATYYYFVVLNKPKKLAAVPAPAVKKGTAAAAKRKIIKKKEEEKIDGPNMTVLYYSQTGTAEDFAQRMAAEGKQYGLHAKVVDVEEYDTDNFTGDKHTVVVFCVATYGEGEPPENALAFHTWLLDEERLSSLMNGTKFSVFGLGDRTFDFFNKMGKVVDTRMEELGAERICERGEGDANANIEEDFLKWKKQFWTNARVALGLGEKKVMKMERKMTMKLFEETELESADSDVSRISRWKPVPAGAKMPAHFDIRHTYLANILVNRELHTKQSDRSCRHIEIQLPPNLTYEAGDHLAMFPMNSTATTNVLIKLLGVEPDQILALYSKEDPNSVILGPCTLFAALQGYYDLLAPPRKPMLTMLAEYTTDQEEKKRLLTLASDDPEAQEEYNRYILHDVRTIAEVLAAFPNSRPPLDHFLELLPRLQPRYYSISSSPHATPGVVHITAALVEFATPTQRVHNGVATSWFSNPEQIPAANAASTGAFPKVPIFIRKSAFHLPKLQTSIIMVGPGTGLAPFRGFLHERQWQVAQSPSDVVPGQNVLFFGCRHPDHDFIYSDELKAFENAKHAELHLAFSRQTEKKVYVQHLMREPETADRIFQLIESGAYIYVCGDAKAMAKDVNHALRDIIVQKRGISESAAESFIDNLRTTNRYLCDVW